MRGLALAAWLALAPLLAARPARAFFGSSTKGTSGAQFLEIAPGARATALGSAFGGIADDVESVYYNPAGLGQLRRPEVTGMHDAVFQGLQYDFLAAAAPLLTWSREQRDKSSDGVLGVAVYSLSIPDIQGRGLVETDAPVDTFNASDMAYALSYGLRPGGGNFSVGATIKSVQQTIDSTRGSAVAFDAGGLYRGDRLSLGAGVRDAGRPVQFGTAADPLPTMGYLGVGYQLSVDWLLAAELDAPRDGPAAFAGGLEYRTLVSRRLAASARFGYNSGDTDAGSFAGAAMGVGLSYGSLQFDFAFVPFGVLGNSYQYSLGLRF